jgi:hypothetical protein
MKIYEVENFSDDPIASYHPSLEEAKREARLSTKSYEMDDGGWGGHEASEAEIFVFDLKPTKANVIAVLNQCQWRPERKLVARFEGGKEVPINEG